MNRVFRTTWSDVHQQYVVVNEKQPGKGKASKSVVALAVASALMLGAAASSAAYIEAGKLGQTTSWESDEYKGDWGLTSINASVAYAMGINGSSVKVGVVDSGTARNAGRSLAQCDDDWQVLPYRHPLSEPERSGYQQQVPCRQLRV